MSLHSIWRIQSGGRGTFIPFKISKNRERKNLKKEHKKRETFIELVYWFDLYVYTSAKEPI